MLHAFEAYVKKYTDGDRDIQVTLLVDHSDVVTLAAIAEYKRRGLCKITIEPLQGLLVQDPDPVAVTTPMSVNGKDNQPVKTGAKRGASIIKHQFRPSDADDLVCFYCHENRDTDIHEEAPEPAAQEPAAV